MTSRSALTAFALLSATLTGVTLMAQTDTTGTVLYVSPGGDDAWSGSLAEPNAAGTDGPLATLAGARDAIRELKVKQGGIGAAVTVQIRGGSYFLAEPLVFTPEDSGTQACPITYMAYPGESPLITGGQVIDGWTQDADGAWSVVLDEVANGDWYFRQLFIKRPDRDYYERRYRPSKGAMVIAGLTNSPAREGMAHRRSQEDFRFFPGDVEPWENLEDVEVVALHDWSSSRLRIRELDMENHIVTFTGFPVYRIGAWWEDGRNPYYCENVREAFGQPGEWYLDRASGLLRYTPLPGETIDEIEFVAPRTEQLVILKGDSDAGLLVENVNFRGLGFAHTHWTLPEQGYSAGQGMTDLAAAWSASSAHGCTVEECTFAHLGAYALEFGGGCSENRAVGNRMFDLGGGGVKVGGRGPTPTGNVIQNNVISDGGLVHFSAHGIWAGITDGTIIRHNVVRRFLYSNISVGWSWNDKPTASKNSVVEANHIHDAMMLLADGGAIYTLGFMPGMVIRENHIHDVHRSKFAGRAPNNGFFFDQGSKEFLCERNIIYRTSGQPVRHNQNKPEWHTWVDNALNVEPGQDGFPEIVAARAGLEEAYRHMDAEQIPVNPTPILSMPLPPPPPPQPIEDSFEKDALDNGPTKRTVQGADENVHIRVTDETAAVGQQSMKFTDGPGAAKSFYPYLIYRPNFVDGIATVSLHLRLEENCRVGLDLRDYFEGGFANGVSLSFDGSGNIRAGDVQLAQVPLSEWFRVEITVGIGERKSGIYSVKVTAPDGEVMADEDLPITDDRFVNLDWVSVISHATTNCHFYLDEVEISYEN